MGADLELGATVDTDVMVGDDADSNADIGPLFQAPYTTNRTRFAFLSIALVLINSFTFHRWVAKALIEVPPDEFNITNVYSRYLNKTQEYSDAFVREVEEHHHMLRTQVNETLNAETSRAGKLQVLNAELLQVQLREENEIRAKNDAIAFYLQAWTRVGNNIPYYPTVSDKDQMFLENSLQLENGAIVKELGELSLTLTDSIFATVAYNEEYVGNKTAGLLRTLIPTVSVSLQIPDLKDSIREAVRATHDQLVVRLTDVRKQFGDVYDTLHQQLTDTQLGLEQMGEAYRQLLETVQEFYSVLDSINIIGLNVNIFPRIDIDSFPPPEFFKPDIIVFPATIDFLFPLDNILDLIDTDFDILMQNIFGRVQIQVDNNAGEVISELVDALTPDDYNPPPIINPEDGKVLSSSEALLLNAEITAKLANQVNKIPSSPQISTEVPSITYPDIMLQYTTFDLVQQTKEFFPWKIADFDFDLPPFVMDALLLIWMYWIVVEIFFWKVYACGKTAWSYFEGTAIAEPVLDIRTKAEIRHQKNRKKGKWGMLASFIYHPQVMSMAKRLLFFVISALIILCGRSYFFGEFEQSCVLSKDGTGTGHATILPLVESRALTDGIKRANDLNLQSHLYIQQQCQGRSIHTHEALQRQRFEFNNIKAKIMFHAKRIQDLRQQVNADVLCQQHQLACQDADPRFECPTLEDGTIVGDPCDFMATDFQLSDTVLHDIKYVCTFEPSYELIVDDRKERINEKLEVQENWCLVEWSVIGHAWRAVYALASFALLYTAFRWIEDGLKRIHWTSLIPEKYRSNCTTDVEGAFTQPEYSDSEEWKRASVEYKKTKNFYGGLHFWAGVGLLLFYGCMTMRMAHVSRAPLWLEAFRQRA